MRHPIAWALFRPVFTGIKRYFTLFQTTTGIYSASYLPVCFTRHYTLTKLRSSDCIPPPPLFLTDQSGRCTHLLLNLYKYSPFLPVDANYSDDDSDDSDNKNEGVLLPSASDCRVEINMFIIFTIYIYIFIYIVTSK